MTGECVIWDFGREADSLGTLSVQPGVGGREGEIRVGEILDPLLLLLSDTKHPLART